MRAAGHTIVRRKGWAEYFQGRQDPASDPDVEWYSSLSLGGLSNYWTAAVPRFAPEDFTDGARLDERYRWPLTYDELVPYYEDVERMLGITDGVSEILHVPTNCARHVERLPEDWAAVVRRAAAAGNGIGALPMAKGTPWMVAAPRHRVLQLPLLVRAAAGLPALPTPGRSSRHAPALVGRRRRPTAVEYVDRRPGGLDRAAGASRRGRRRRDRLDGDPAALDVARLPDGLGNTDGLVGRYLHDHPREWWTAQPDRPMTSLDPPGLRRPRDYDVGGAAARQLADPRPDVGEQIGSSRCTADEWRQFGVQVFGTMVPTPDVGVAPRRRRSGGARRGSTGHLAALRRRRRRQPGWRPSAARRTS